MECDLEKYENLLFLKQMKEMNSYLEIITSININLEAISCNRIPGGGLPNKNDGDDRRNC